MRLLSLAWKGITAFPDEVLIDFTRLPQGLVALVGPNGAGKTTVMELSGPLTLFLRSIYYECTFIDMVRTGCRDAFSELYWETDGVLYALKISGDSKTRKTEAILQVAGVAVAGPTLTDVRTHLDAILPGFALFLASAFAAQRNATSFFELTASKRKDMLIEAMQLGALQELSEAADQHAKDRVSQIEVLRGQADVITTDAFELRSSETAIATEREQLTVALAEHEAAQLAAQDARTQRDLAEAEVRAEVERYQRAKEDYDRIEKERQQHEVDVRALTESRDRTSRLVAGLDAKRVIAAQVEEHRLALVGEESSRDELLNRRTEATRQVEAAERKLAVLRTQAQGVMETKKSADRIAQAVKDVDTDRDICKVCPLTAEGMRGEQELKSATRSLELLTEQGKAAVAEVARAKDVEREASKAFGAAMDAVLKRQGTIGKLSSEASGLQEAEKAAGRLTALDEQLLAMATVVLPELPPAPVLKVPESKAIRDRFSETVAHAVAIQEEVDRLRTHVERREGRMAVLRERVAQLDVIEQKLRVAEEDHVTWVQLAKALGRDGIQALEIDAAGPLIQSIANELLITCYGTRFALKFITTEPKKGKGGGVKEVFECQIIDALAGRIVSRGSGGEQVIIDEALRLSLSIYASMKSGREQRTLWRDESVGPLDPKNAAAYVAMLRRAMQLGGFERCLLIAHTQEVWEGCDAQIFVGDGGVRIAA